MKTKQPAELIEQLVEQGGAIVTSQDCSIIEIADAQATGRWAVDDKGIGYVRRYREWLAMVLARNLSEAVNLSCSCGGNPAGTEACPACMVWHRMNEFPSSPNDQVEARRK